METFEKDKTGKLLYSQVELRGVGWGGGWGWGGEGDEGNGAPTRCWMKYFTVS